MKSNGFIKTDKKYSQNGYMESIEESFYYRKGNVDLAIADK